MGLVGRGRGEAGNEAVRRADLILGLGVKFDFQTTRFNYDLIPETAKIIHISINPEELGRIYPLTLGVNCEVGPVVQCLRDAAWRRGVNAGLGEAARQIKLKAQAKLDAEINYEMLPLQPQAVLRTLRELLPQETSVVVDGGNFAKHVRRHFPIIENDSFNYPDDFGSVGASYPMALGAKAALPDRPVVCLVGDGGFLLNSQELETAAREKLNVLAVVFNDFSFGNVRAYQKEKYGGRYSCNYTNPPFDQMAKLFGADGAHVETLDELRAAVQRGLTCDGPFVIDVMMSPDALSKPGFLLGVG